MRSVKPCYIKFNQQYINPTYDIVPFLSFLVLIMSSFTFFRAEITIMPEFTPTEWMLDNKKDKSEEGHDWEIFAECLRETMAKSGGFKIDNRPIREKLAYENFMCGDAAECTIDGKTFSWAAGGRVDKSTEAKKE